MSAIKQIFPLGSQWQTLDPFLFCAYHKDDYPRGNGTFGPAEPLSGRQIGQDFANLNGWNMYHGDRVPGFPAHPHRGFETITVVNRGLVDHSDSLGAAGRYGGGDTQWLTAGKGIQHSEMFPLVKEDEENPLLLFQIWLNLPAKNKMVEPHFKMLWKDQIPLVEVEDENGISTTVQIVAGELNGQRPPSPPPASWAADENNRVAVWNIRIPAQGSFELPADEADLSRILYFYTGGQAVVDGQNIKQMNATLLASDQAITITAGDQACEFMLLQGRPIAEPVTQYGPFVMNSEQEIHQTFADYRQTQFGGWPWADADQVHKEAANRFAKHADGKVEEREPI
ncbi:MAG: pirin-like C-terminal cupin domain-containing protein [Reinekea sp.]|jgi:quercetin 2,3-dioxygenase